MNELTVDTCSAPILTVLRRSHPVADKVHTCAICGEDIAIGERYKREVFLEDSVFVSQAVHLRDCVYGEV